MGASTAFLIAGILTGVDPALIEAICFVESGHRQDAYVAKDGASASYGQCQVKLRTARGMGFTGSEADLMHPATNALYAGKYLAYQHKRYGNWKEAISAYNCGRACNNKSYVQRVGDEWKRRK